MNNFREVNDDILKEWLEFREETAFCEMSPQDKKYCIYFEEIAEKILKNVPKQNKKYVQKQLNQLDKNFMDYLYYWNEKYYRNGFVDGVQLIGGCFEESFHKINRWIFEILVNFSNFPPFLLLYYILSFFNIIDTMPHIIPPTGYTTQFMYHIFKVNPHTRKIIVVANIIIPHIFPTLLSTFLYSYVFS